MTLSSQIKAIFATVKDKSALQVIDLTCNSITDVGAQYICQFLHVRTKHHLNAASTCTLTVTDFTSLSSLI